MMRSKVSLLFGQVSCLRVLWAFRVTLRNPARSPGSRVNQKRFKRGACVRARLSMWRVMCTWVGSCLFLCWFPVGQWERDQLAPPSISHHLGFAQQFLTEALIIAPGGPPRLRQQLGKGDGLVDVHLSVCLSVPHHLPIAPPPISPLYLLYPRTWNVHDLRVSSFSGKTAGRASLAPFHVYSGCGLGSQLPAGHLVFKCFCYKWI